MFLYAATTTRYSHPLTSGGDLAWTRGAAAHSARLLQRADGDPTQMEGRRQGTAMTTENPTSFKQACSGGWPHPPNRSASPDGGPVWVTGGKTPSEYIVSELPQVADIAGARFTIWRAPSYRRSRRSGPSNSRGGALTQKCHEIIQNRLALVREQSVSVGHRRQPLPGQLGEPTHAHLHHRQ